MDRTVLGLAEIVLWTHDMERALHFYRDLFGLEPMEAPEGVMPRFLRAAQGPGGVPQMIVLVPHPEAGSAFPREKPTRVLHHLAFNVGAARYEELRERLASEGLEVRGGIHPVLRGVRTFYVDDPEGNEVEVIAPEG
ncbi:MAG: VOC family protein [Actinomycetota bacterium]